MNKEVFDLIIPIGASCKPAFYLKENNFRKCAYPFDWNLNSFFGVRRLFENNFEDYFSDYSDVSDSNKHDIGYKVINDNKNNIRCMHYIFDDGDIDSQVKNYAIMMKKRFFR